MATKITPEWRREYAREYRKRNRALLRAKEEARRLLEPEKSRESSRKYSLANKEKRAEISKRHYLNNREEIATKDAERYRENKPAFVARSARCRVSDRVPNDACLLTIQRFYEASARISKCLKIKFHVDHITPIAREGLHHQCNLQILPRVLNIRKGSGPEFIWAAA